MDLDIFTVLMSDNKYYGDSDICIIEKWRQTFCNMNMTMIIPNGLPPLEIFSYTFIS